MQFEAHLEDFRRDDFNCAYVYQAWIAGVAIYNNVRCTGMDGLIVSCTGLDGFLIQNVSFSPINNTLYGCKNERLAKANAHRTHPDIPE